jgi:exonuclease III
MNPDLRRFTYYPRSRPWGSSCDRVDYMIASKRLWDTGRVTAAGMLDSEAGRGPSDHVPIWVDINVQARVESMENGT